MFMDILSFDELNTFTEFHRWLDALPTSEVMERKSEVRDRVYDILEYAYMLGYSRASEELGVIADDVEEFLPKDYRERAEESIFREVGGKDFAERVTEHSEMGDKNAIYKVVETDGNRVYNAGGLLGARDRAKTKTWNTMLDDRVRDTHDYLEKMTVGIDEEFYTYDGDHAPCPGMFQRPENSINCRCTLSFNL